MSWTTNTILVRPARLAGDPDELLDHLGYAKRRRGKETSFAMAGSATIWVGGVGDLIIMNTDFAHHFFDRFVDDPLDQDFAYFKSGLLRHFSEVDVAAFVVDGRVDAWGFAVYRSGTLIRRFYGHDGALFGDEGTGLPEETMYFANCDRIESNGEVLFRSRSNPRCEPLSVAYHGGDVLLNVWRSFAGYRYDAPEFDRISGTNFWLWR
jgi:hypothetical protein